MIVSIWLIVGLQQGTKIRKISLLLLFLNCQLLVLNAQSSPKKNTDSGILLKKDDDD